jgi:lipoprotein-anchoring transpeptidase ErfK/SrfK
VTAELPALLLSIPTIAFCVWFSESSQAKRYGIGVGREEFGWSGTATVMRKTEWRDRGAARWRKGMRGGPRNPLGAQALYLFQVNIGTLFRIHGPLGLKAKIMSFGD